MQLSFVETEDWQCLLDFEVRTLDRRWVHTVQKRPGLPLVQKRSVGPDP